MSWSMSWSMPERAAMTAAAPFLIVGAGQAGATAAAACGAWATPGASCSPATRHRCSYERPPLTKAVLADAGMDGRIGIHPAGFHDAQAIELRLGAGVVAIDAARRLARFGDGSELAFGRCLIATGGRARTLPSLPPGTPHVHHVRTLADAQALRAAMAGLRSLCVLGGGFLGLEVAATARAAGLCGERHRGRAAAVVARGAARVLGLARRACGGAGVALRLGRSCTSIEPKADGVALALDDGSTLHAPLLVVAIGQTPEVALARDCGLALHPHNGGIRIDARAAPVRRTSTPPATAPARSSRWPARNCGSNPGRAPTSRRASPPRCSACRPRPPPRPGSGATSSAATSRCSGCPARPPPTTCAARPRSTARRDSCCSASMQTIASGTRSRSTPAATCGPCARWSGSASLRPRAWRDVSIPPRQLVRNALSAAASPSLS